MKSFSSNLGPEHRKETGVEEGNSRVQPIGAELGRYQRDPRGALGFAFGF